MLQGLLLATLLCSSSFGLFGQSKAPRAVRGVVLDSATQQPLRFVTVRLDQSTKGAVTTQGGAFVIVLPDARDSATLIATMVGYAPTRVTRSSLDTSVTIVLAERALRSAAVVVTAEDPAYRIMRKVLLRKQRQDTLRRYTYLLYTKFVAITDTLTASRASGRGDSTVFSILESYSKGYVERPDRYFNEIIQRRQTANIPPQANFVAFGTNLNVFDDEVGILGENIESPFSQLALDIYDMRLTSDEEDSIVTIDVKPLSSQRKGFVGTLWINNRSFVPIEVQLTPSEAVNLPFDAKLKYRQTFLHIDDAVVLPEALSIQSTLQADVLFLISPRLDITVETFCSDYDLHPEFDDGIFSQRRVEILPSAFEFDSAYWRANERIPLRPEELSAYDEIAISLENPDSLATATFVDRFLGPIPQYLARLGRRPFTGFEDVARYNRIHGLFLGAGVRFRPDTALEIYSSGGYGTANATLYGQALASLFLGRYQNWRLDVQAYDRLSRRDDQWVVRTPAISFTTLLAGVDYGDYYQNTGASAGLGYSWGQMRFIRNDVYERPNSIDVWVSSEHHRSVHSQDVITVARRDGRFRRNPMIDDGAYRMIGGRVHLMYNPQRMVARTGLGVQWEISDRRLLPTASEYQWVALTGILRTTTLPLWTLDVSMRAGWSNGDVPAQRFFSLESSVAGLAAAGSIRGIGVKEFYGDRYAALNVSHNFGEVVPGLLRIPNIASFGLEFLLTGSVAWSEFATRPNAALPSTTATPDRWYYEAGIAVNRILLFFRFDIGARFSQRQTPGIYFTFGSATF